MPKIKIFTTTTCPYCHMLKEYLKTKNMEYEEVLVDQNPEAAVESLHVCESMGVPCTHITLDDGSEQHVLGFDRARIDQILGLA